MTDLKTTIEFEDYSLKHGETDDEEAAIKEYLVKIGMTVENGEIVIKDQDALQKIVICSCGAFTCSQVSRFGHPVPVFKEDIEPLWPQYARDQRALALKGGEPS